MHDNMVTMKPSQVAINPSAFERWVRYAGGLLLLTACLLQTGAMAQVAAGAQASQGMLAPTPPMGWANWNSLGCNYDEGTIQAMADHMVSSGMREAGYRYLIIQECIVPAGHRAADGTLLPDTKKFPHGIAALVDYIHTKGLKAGIYTDVGAKTCGEYEGSFNHEEQDARTFAGWGVDLIEEDFCFKPSGYTAAKLYTRMRDAISKTHRPMLLYICNQGKELAWTWAPKLSNVWRSTEDVAPPGHADWTRMLRNFDQNALHADRGGPNHWSDPDMLEVGVLGMDATEDRSMFSLWAMVAAPLWAGNDLRAMTPETLENLTNREVIAVDQDALGEPATLVQDYPPGLQVWSRPLAGPGSAHAVLLFNRTSKQAEMHVLWDEIGIYYPVRARDLWAHKDLGPMPEKVNAYHLAGAEYVTTVPAHGVVMLRVSR